jgi:hypothetical protein
VSARRPSGSSGHWQPSRRAPARACPRVPRRSRCGRCDDQCPVGPDEHSQLPRAGTSLTNRPQHPCIHAAQQRAMSAAGDPWASTWAPWATPTSGNGLEMAADQGFQMERTTRSGRRDSNPRPSPSVARS